MLAIDQLRAAWAPRLLSVLRIMTSLLFLQHGMAKWVGFPVVPGMGSPSLITLSGFGGGIELVGSVLLALGLFSVPVAFIMSGEMAIAYFVAHAPNNFFPLLNRGEAAILFSFIFLYIAAAGPGPWSVDAARK